MPWPRPQDFKRTALPSFSPETDFPTATCLLWQTAFFSHLAPIASGTSGETVLLLNPAMFMLRLLNVAQVPHSAAPSPLGFFTGGVGGGELRGSPTPAGRARRDTLRPHEPGEQVQRDKAAGKGLATA